MPKLKVGDRLPYIERLEYRCLHWKDQKRWDIHYNSTRDYIITGITCEDYIYDRKEIGANETNYYSKISDIDKHIMETSQHNLAPQTFAITGSKSLLKAMEEELVAIGYSNEKISDRESKFLITNTPTTKSGVFWTKENFSELFYWKDTYEADAQFQLPQQWDECLKFCKEQLELWDKPKFKEGDKIIILSHSKHCWYRNHVGEIFTLLNPVKNTKEEHWYIKEKSEIGLGVRIKDIRIATQEEIEAAQSITIAGYKMEVVNDKVKFGCQYITKVEIETLRKFISHPFDFNITVGDDKINKELLNKILDKL